MVVIMTPHLAIGLAVLTVFAVLSRIVYILLTVWFSYPTMVSSRGVRALVVLGSGGHTGEMLVLVRGLSEAVYTSRVYVVANTDSLSMERVRHEEDRRVKRVSEQRNVKDPETSKVHCGLLSSEDSFNELHCRNVSKKRTDAIFLPDCNCPANSSEGTNFSTRRADSMIEIIPRSREVGQSYITSVYTTLIALVYALKIVFSHKPNLILVNGPGSCVPVCFAGLFFRVLGVCSPRIVFVESLCRVRTMSLTGKILYWFADDFLVQWPTLKEKYPRSKYLGRLV